MKLLHVTPHLGGGVGKAHAALGADLPGIVERIFLLLEEPRDRRYVDAIAASGARIVVSPGLDQVAALARDADIVQFEFWNHPRLFECLARGIFPAMRSVIWSHISGLARPLIPAGLLQEAGRFVFTTDASLALPEVAALDPAIARKVAVINSAFGFAETPRMTRANRTNPVIAYLGTVDFIKMHPGFFDVIDRLAGGDIRVEVWGEADEAVTARARAMCYPERIAFRGATADPAGALAQADIFFYPLRPDHYGTAENALIEAMSLGLVPVVLGNPAEQAIVRDGETGFVAYTLDDCVSLLQMLLLLPELREKIARNAVRHMAESRTPAQAAQAFMILWLGLLGEEPRACDFSRVLGKNPADWFLATQCRPGDGWPWTGCGQAGKPAKGTLAHYESTFVGDASLSQLRKQGHAPREAPRRQPVQVVA